MNIVNLSIDFGNIAAADGYTIALVSFLLVLISLSILFIIFQSIPKLLLIKIRKKLKKARPEDTGKVEHMDSHVSTAIAMAIHLYFNEVHDNESNVITIKNAKKMYSPWSSKIYNMNNQLRKK